MNLKETVTFPRNAPYFAGHFPENPIVPGVILLAEMTDLLKKEGIVLKEILSTKFFSPVLPEEEIIISVQGDKGSTTLRFKGMRPNIEAPVFSGVAKI
ncbi:MAG: hypothetical protein ACTSXQ_02890 [Alphaproteobacteria bacterium]